MDRALFGFAGLQATGEPVKDGDIAFDEEPCATTVGISSIISLHPAD